MSSIICCPKIILNLLFDLLYLHRKEGGFNGESGAPGEGDAHGGAAAGGAGSPLRHGAASFLLSATMTRHQGQETAVEDEVSPGRREERRTTSSSCSGRAVSIDTDKKVVRGASGRTLDYDVAVFATGSYPYRRDRLSLSRGSLTRLSHEDLSRGSLTKLSLTRDVLLRT